MLEVVVTDTCYTPFRMAFHSTDCTQLTSPFFCWKTFVLSQTLWCYPSRLPRTKSPGPWDSFLRVLWAMLLGEELLGSGTGPKSTPPCTLVSNVTVLTSERWLTVLCPSHLSYFCHYHQQWVDSGRHGGNSPHSFSPPNYLLYDLSVWFLIHTHSFFSL